MNNEQAKIMLILKYGGLAEAFFSPSEFNKQETEVLQEWIDKEIIKSAERCERN